MIDATRFNSLATALKDRPSKVPDQPNRSLPLRPLPSTPTRSALVKSPKKSPSAKANCPESTSETEEAISRLSVNPVSIGPRESAENSRLVEASRSPSCGQESLGLHFYDTKSRNDDTQERAKSHENSHGRTSKEFTNLDAETLFLGAEREESRSQEVGRKRRRSSAKDVTERVGKIATTAQLDESKDEATIPKRKRLSCDTENASVSSLSDMELAKSRKTVPKCPESISIESARRYNKLYPMVLKPLESSADLPSMPTLDDAYIGSRETDVELNEIKIVETWSYNESVTPQRRTVASAVTSSTRGDSVDEFVAWEPKRSVETLDADESRLDEKIEEEKKTLRLCREDIRETVGTSDTTIQKQNENTIHSTTSDRRTPNSRPLEARSPENAARESAEVVQKAESTAQVNEASVTTEQNKLTLELLKLSKEQTELRCRLKHTDDSAHRLRLQQRLNCADKKIENTMKYLSKLTETIKSNKKQRPLRIQVRRDLGQTLDTSEPSPTPSQPEDAISNCEPIAPLVGHTVPTNMISPAIEGAVSVTSDPQPEPSTRPDREPTTKSGSQHPESNIDADTRNIGGSLVGSLGREIPIEREMSRVWYPKTINNNEEYSNKHLAPSYKADVCRPDEAAGSTISDGTATNPLNALDQIVNGQYPLPVSSANLHPTMNQDAMHFNLNQQRHYQYTRPASATATNLIDAMIPTPVSDIVASNHLGPEVRNGAINLSPNRARGTKQTTNENSQGMFSRGNGGANINLSSPLQGHSVIPMPQPMYGQMTAQEYPLLVEANRTQQSTHPSVHHKVMKNSSSPYNTDGNAPTSQLQFSTDTLTNSQTRASANAFRSTEPQNLTKKKRATRARSTDQVTRRIISEQFPTLGNWAAQMTGNSNIVPDNRTTLAANLSTPVPTSLPTMEDASGFRLPARESYNTTTPVIDGSYFNVLANGGSHWAPEMHPHNQKRAMQGYNNQSSGVLRTHPGNYMATPSPYSPASTYPPGMSRLIHHYPPSATQNNHPVQSPIEQSPHESTYQLPPKSAQTYGAIPTGTHRMQMTAAGNLNLLQSSDLLPSPYAHVPSSHAPSQQPGYYLFPNVAVPDKPPPSYPGTHVRSQPSDKFSRNDVRKPPGNLQYQKHIPKVYSDVNMQIAGRETQDQRQVPTYDARDYRLNCQIGQYDPCVYPNPSNSWHCTLCGAPGAVFNCDGCEMAFYCSENCQRQHWSTHYSDCSKKMPKLKRVM